MLAVLALLLLLIGGGGWYGWTGYVWRHKKCGKCQGRGYEPPRGLWSRSPYRTCQRCQGYGRVLRTAARHVNARRGRAGKRARR